MPNINTLVKTIQQNAEESTEYIIAYADLFDKIYRDTIFPKVNCFQYQLRGDVEEGYALGADLLMELVEKWTGEGNFISWYNHSLDNRLINLYQSMTRDKRKHNTSYEVTLSDSLSEFSNTGDSDISATDAITADRSLTTTLEASQETVNPLEGLIDNYTENHPTQAGIIQLMLKFPDDMHQSKKTDAYCEYYGVQEYTPAIQKRVSRVRDSFKKFLHDSDYAVAF